jgi:hypothetical protein
MRRITALAAALLCTGMAACAGAGSNGDAIALFNDDKSGDTGRFAPSGAWDLSYSWDCARAKAEGTLDAHGLDLVVYNADDDSTAFENPEARSGATKGSAVLHYRRPGVYYVGLQTPCEWQVTVIDRSQ